MGLANYFQNYIPCFLLLVVPLFKLTRSTVEWRGGELPPEAFRAFNNIQAAPFPAMGPRGDWVPC
jgi:hypothetical protein